MSTITVARKPRNVKPPREKPPQAVHGRCRWVRRLLTPDGIGTLAINGVHYDLEAHLDGNRVLGYRLVKADDTAYDLDASGEYFTCDCPDGTYRPNRPGACKHVRALQVAGLLPAAPLAVLDRMARPLPADGLTPDESEDRPATATPERGPAYRSLGHAMRNAPESFACDCEHDPADLDAF